MKVSQIEKQVQVALDRQSQSKNHYVALVGGRFAISSQPAVTLRILSNEVGISVMARQFVKSNLSKLGKLPSVGGILFKLLHVDKSRTRKCVSDPRESGILSSFLQARKSSNAKLLTIPMFAGKLVIPLHFVSTRSSNRVHFSMFSGREVSPMHFDNESSTRLQSRIDPGSLSTHLHSLMFNVFNLLSPPMDSGRLLSALHLSRFNSSRLQSWPNVSGRCSMTLLPVPLCPPILRRFKLERKKKSAKML